MRGQRTGKFGKNNSNEEFRHPSQEYLRDDSSSRLIEDSDIMDPAQNLVLSRSSDNRRDLYIEKTPSASNTSANVRNSELRDSETVDASELDESNRTGGDGKNLHIDRHNNVIRTNILDD